MANRKDLAAKLREVASRYTAMVEGGSTLDREGIPMATLDPARTKAIIANFETGAINISIRLVRTFSGKLELDIVRRSTTLSRLDAETTEVLTQLNGDSYSAVSAEQERAVLASIALDAKLAAIGRLRKELDALEVQVRDPRRRQVFIRQVEEAYKHLLDTVH